MVGFSKDILVLDFETTGLDLEKSLPIQLEQFCWTSKT